MPRLRHVVRLRILTCHAGDFSCLASFVRSVVVASSARFVRPRLRQDCCRCRWQEWGSWVVRRRNRHRPRIKHKETLHRLLVQQVVECLLAECLLVECLLAECRLVAKVECLRLVAKVECLREWR